MNQLRMILFIGMNSNLITYPIAPMTQNPIAHELAILRYSFRSGFLHLLKNI